MRGLPSIPSLVRNEFNKLNNTRARMLDSIYHIEISFYDFVIMYAALFWTSFHNVAQILKQLRK